MSAGNRIETLRERLGLSYQELAHAAKVSDETVSRWCKGVGKKGPSLEQAIRLARRLGTTVEYLATGRQPMPTELTEDEAYIVQAFRDLGLTRAVAFRALSAAAHGNASPFTGDYPTDAGGETDLPPPGRPPGKKRA